MQGAVFGGWFREYLVTSGTPTWWPWAGSHAFPEARKGPTLWSVASLGLGAGLLAAGLGAGLRVAGPGDAKGALSRRVSDRRVC